MTSTALKAVRKFFPKVKSVTDATRSAQVEVTKSDASSKAVRQHDACAMAVACKRKFHLDGVIIARSVAYLIKGTEARRFKLPSSVSREIVSFDRGAGFAVGKYQLSAVPKSIKLGSQYGSHSHGDRKNPTYKRVKHITTNVRHVLGGQKPEGE